MNDEQLVRAVAAGVVPAFDTLVERHRAAVLRLAARYSREVEDIAQEVFLRIWRSASTFREDARFKTWLYRVVVNCCLEQRRKRRPEVTSDLPERAVSERGSSDHIRAAVDSLPPRQRLAVILKRFEGLSYAEIADVMDITPGTVEQTLTQAYENLRGRLGSLNKGSPAGRLSVDER